MNEPAAPRVSGCTKMIVASGATPTNRPAGKAASPDRPLPAAVPVTWVPWLAGAGRWRTTENGFGSFSAVLIASASYSTPRVKPAGADSPGRGLSDWSQRNAMRVLPSELVKSSRVKSSPMSTIPTMAPVPVSAGRGGAGLCS